MGRREIEPFQSVFKINLKQNGSEGSLHIPTRQYVSRKAHTKSRSGCRSCKKRRVKCDEVKPACKRCTRLDQECVYREALSPSVDGPARIESSMTPVLSSEMYSMSIDLIETDIDSLLFSGPMASDLDGSEAGNARILQHFQTAASSTLGCSMTKAVMQSFVGSDAWDHPYLMHMILAISCAHQKRLGVMDCSLAEATHWERGLQLHRENLATMKPGQSNQSWDSVVATTFLAIMYTFSLDDEISIDSLSSCDDALEHVFAPMAATGGFRSLFYLFPGEVDPFSKWTPILNSTDGDVFRSEEPGICGLPRRFVELCELDECSTVNNNAYHKILRGLTPLLHLRPSTENFALMFAFLGRTWPDFKPLVYRKDPRALLLMSYWLGLLRQVDQWWLTKRALTECNAIVAYLLKLQDPRINSLLPFPAAFALSDASQMWELLGYAVDDTVYVEASA